MELRQLRVFIAVADDRSFTRAADHLFLTQSAVSSSVQVLERELGVTLIDRTVQPVALTDVGHAFLERARQTVAAADAALQVARDALTGTVTVGFMSVPRSSAPTLPGMIAAFRKVHPGITVVARHVDGSIREAELVRSGQLDLAVLSLGDKPVSGVRKRPLWDEPIVFVCRRDHPLAGASSVSAQQMQPHALASLPPTWCVSTTTDGWFRRKDTIPRIDYVVNDVLALLDFIVDGDAAALLPASFIAGHEALVGVPIEDRPVFVTELATPQDRSLSPVGEAFAAWVREHASRSRMEQAAVERT